MSSRHAKREPGWQPRSPTYRQGAQGGSVRQGHQMNDARLEAKRQVVMGFCITINQRASAPAAPSAITATSRMPLLHLHR